MIGIKVFTYTQNKLPSIRIGFCAGRRKKFRMENPVHQIIFIPKMIIETFPVHTADVTDVADTDLGKRHGAKQCFHRFCERFFRNIRVCQSLFPPFAKSSISNRYKNCNEREKNFFWDRFFKLGKNKTDNNIVEYPFKNHSSIMQKVKTI